MEQRLVPLNAVLGMYSSTMTSWPKPFSDAGYQLQALEFPVRFEDRAESIVVDAIGFRSSQNRFALHEVKSGTSVTGPQARKYAAADPAYLVRALSVTVGPGGSPRTQSNYVCLRESEERVLWLLSEAGVDLPVISIGPTDISATGTPFEDADLAAAFAQPIPVPGPPPGIVTVDAESPDQAFDQLVYPSLVAAASLSEETISVTRLAEMSLAHYPIYPAQYQKRLRTRVAEAVIRAAAADPQHWTFQKFQGANEDGMVRVVATPEQTDPRGRTQQYQAMRSRLQSGQRRRPRPEIPGQGQFFSTESDVEKELERARNSDDENGEEEP